MSYLVVVPAIDSTDTKAFLRSSRIPHENILIVDNTIKGMTLPPRLQVVHRGYNMGVAASWNLGRQRLRPQALTWLVIASTSLRFGPAGGLDFIAGLDDAPGDGAHTHCGWHLVALHVRALTRVGPFDEGFWPAYFEETDYLYRMGLKDFDSPRENGREFHFIETTCQTGRIAAATVDRRAPNRMLEMENRYIAKWGGPQGEEKFKLPWGPV